MKKLHQGGVCLPYCVCHPHGSSNTVKMSINEVTLLCVLVVKEKSSIWGLNRKNHGKITKLIKGTKIIYTYETSCFSIFDYPL